MAGHTASDRRPAPMQRAGIPVLFLRQSATKLGISNPEVVILRAIATRQACPVKPSSVPASFTSASRHSGPAD